LVIAAHREDRLKALVESLPNADISYAVADVTNKEEVLAVIDLAVEKYGHVDVLFNNAGIMLQAPLSDLRMEEWRQMLDINIIGVLNGIAAALTIMQKQQSGHIVTTASFLIYPYTAKGSRVLHVPAILSTILLKVLWTFYRGSAAAAFPLLYSLLY
jgi:NADP-dependent 3-hydroxy acid dehydrogenase YdfG